MPGESPCDVTALKACLARHQGDAAHCQHLVQAFARSCAQPPGPQPGPQPSSPAGGR